MADYGMQVWDAVGNLMYTLSTRMSRILGIAHITTTTGNFTNADFAQGDPWYVMLPRSGSSGLVIQNPVVSVSGNVISWNLTGFTPNHTLIYGVY